MSGADPGDSFPRPDPTVLTTEALAREVATLRREIAGQRELLEAKLAGHTKFSDGRHADLQELMKQRIDAVERHFDLHLAEARHQLQDQINAERRATGAEVTSATKAIDKAEEATEKRFDAVNEFRAQLSDQSQTFLRRDMFDQHVREARETAQTMQTRIEANATQLLTLSASESGGRDREAQARANMATIFAAIATLVAVTTLVMALVQ